MSHDPVNHPNHYVNKPVECIEVSEHLGFCLGNAFKYVYRHVSKDNPVQDLKKALWYLCRHKINLDYKPNVPNRIFEDVQLITETEHNERVRVALTLIPVLACLDITKPSEGETSLAIFNKIEAAITEEIHVLTNKLS